MIGIIAAMDMEVEAIEKLSTITKTEQVATCTLHYGTMHGKDIVIAKCGIGKTHAAMATAILCTQHNLEAIINIGTAGGLKDDQQVLDIVISKMVVQADFDLTALDGPDAYGLVYEPDQKLVDVCTTCAKDLGIRYHVGWIASQDLFMSRKEDLDKLMAHFPESACSEMEAGAIAQVAHSFQVPYVIVRALSDVAVHSDNPMEFSEYAPKASAQSARLVETFIERL
ncbi:MAG: 5'-methylthioadenosine/adenosylhomocysteine nucleosidase [Absicoccus porci]|nr:5'-methylthioadenosine/adenosylhomocysteine nucleosidase [Absicoccus porci]MCI6088653.1 5'-methylthioadenosine/adenosylhomocysteine nucleosidase [Absicoccus porci]MDD6459954.1 5'-methylthioadenosine/adenosylhomocysteine nucleosidase [Absicoccus porci]MDD7330315.1 5'-methylthioadenosine/adenosylhomocysteine nucleosidase [Absicoccus porci]MDY4738716.1 5'-methylthioadenosine/adenosylhomocysteine nucleosidase [Absicoccus porci]MEE1354290.1 5'-methylthioadenosine/adenosylhomocysteine nucleosidas